jgi:uncharacterized membrane protein YccC
MLAALLPVCALLGTSDYPEQASIAFTRGIALAGVLGVLCEFFLLAQVDGFPLLVVVFGPFVIVGSLYATLPKHAGTATAFLIFFPTVINFRNPMQYDVAATLNTAFALFLGSACGVLVFHTVWPVNMPHAIRRLVRQMRVDVRDLADRRHPPLSLTMWETTMLDRLSRLSTRLATSPDRPAVIEGGIAAIHIGREMMRAQLMLGSLTLPADVARSVDSAWRALSGLAAAPDAAAQATKAAALRLLAASGEDPALGERSSLMRVAAAHHEIALLLVRHRAFFAGDLPAAREAS